MLYSGGEYTEIRAMHYDPTHPFPLQPLQPISNLSPRWGAEDVYRAEVSSLNVIGE